MLCVAWRTALSELFGEAVRLCVAAIFALHSHLPQTAPHEPAIALICAGRVADHRTHQLSVPAAVQQPTATHHTACAQQVARRHAA